MWETLPEVRPALAAAFLNHSRSSIAQAEAQMATSRGANGALQSVAANVSRLRNLESSLARERAYREQNADRISEYHREYNRSHLQARLEKNRKWLAENPDKKLEYALRRRALKRGSQVGPVDVTALWTGLCGICGEEIDPALKRPDVMSKSIDHIVPLALGGSHTQENLQWAHLTCNLSKGARLP